DETVVLRQRTDHGMLAHEGHGLLLRGVAVDQGTDGPQVVCAVVRRDPARPLDRRDGMSPGQTQEPHQDTDRLDAPRRDDALGPASAVWSQSPHPGELPGRTPLDAADLLRGDMRRARAEPTGLLPGMDLQLFHPVIE